MGQERKLFAANTNHMSCTTNLPEEFKAALTRRSYHFTLRNSRGAVGFPPSIVQCNFPLLTASILGCVVGSQHKHWLKHYVSRQRTLLFQDRKEVTRIRGKESFSTAYFFNLCLITNFDAEADINQTAVISGSDMFAWR